MHWFKKLNSYLAFRPDVGLFILRLGMGFFMSTHGYNKLLSALDGVTDFPDPLGVGPVISLWLTVAAEFFCSLLLLLGLFTRIALILLINCVLIIAFHIHWSDPLGDKEHALLFLTGYMTIFFTGPGKYSLDAWLGKKKSSK